MNLTNHTRKIIALKNNYVLYNSFYVGLLHICVKKYIIKKKTDLKRAEARRCVSVHDDGGDRRTEESSGKTRNAILWNFLFQ